MGGTEIYAPLERILKS
jgi:hypothetical protein